MADGAAVLADVLAAASKVGPERLVETDRLLRDLLGDDQVQKAHRHWTYRVREGFLRGARSARPANESREASADTFALLRRLRPTRPRRPTA